MPPSPASDSLIHNRPFQFLFWAHVVSLLGSGVGAIAVGLLANRLVGEDVSLVVGITLAIRIVVLVFAAPWAGSVADRFGARRTMIASDIFRAAIVASFFFVTHVWQIYLLAVFLHLGAAIFTPVYKATVPTITTTSQYPRALSIGAVAYDVANILGPTLAAAAIYLVGFQANFLLNAATFLLSATLLFGLPRLGTHLTPGKKPSTSTRAGMLAMFTRPPLRHSLILALKVSIVGGFILVATVNFAKVELDLPEAKSDAAYAWAMAAYGLGSVLGALIYGYCSPRRRNQMVASCALTMALSLAAIATFMLYPILIVAWAFAGACQCILGIKGNELLAENSAIPERPHIYAAHFSLSHIGWGLTYPLAGLGTTYLGFQTTAWIFLALLLALSLSTWLNHRHD